MGMCFPFAAKKAEEWFDQHFEARRGRAPKRHPGEPQELPKGGRESPQTLSKPSLDRK